MKKSVLVFIALVSVYAGFAQDKKNSSPTAIVNRAGDHVMLQFGSDIWTGAPDSILNHKKGISRSANVYIMTNKVFKNNRRFSVAFGLGIGTGNMYFEKYKIDIISQTAKLPFVSLDSADHFKKYKLTTAYVDVPLELRFTSRPEKESKSFKAAIGIKVGSLISAHTKGKTLQGKYGATINNYIEKQSDKQFFNTTRLLATGRVGYGNFSIFATYQVINSMLKDGVGPSIKPLQVGICLSGL
jgi:Outer membrane protein beta-barrel domain